MKSAIGLGLIFNCHNLMKKLVKLVLLVFCFALLSFSSVNSSPTTAPTILTRKTVLILFPYQIDMPHHILAEQALRDEFGKITDLRLDLYFEYMDLNRFPGEALQQQFWGLYAAKYASKQIDLVIIVNESILTLWLEGGDEVAPSVPVVFFDIPTGWVAEQHTPANLTGVTATLDYTRSIEWFLQARPLVNEIVLVHGVGVADQEDFYAIRHLLDVYQERLKFTDLSNLPLDEIKRRVTELPETAVVLYHLMFEDASGERYRPIDALRELAEVSSVPVISGYDQFIGTGSLGGYVYSIEEQARQAAQIGLRILRGEPANSIPISTDQSNRFVFDYSVLVRYDIPIGMLPLGSVIKNREETLWERYRAQFLALFAGFSLLLLLVVHLLRINHQLRQARLDLEFLNENLETQVRERTSQLSQANQYLENQISERTVIGEALKSSEERYRFLTENIKDVIWVFDLVEKRFTYVSPSVEPFLGYTADEIIARSLAEIFPPVSFDKVREGIEKTLAAYLQYPSNLQLDSNEMVLNRKDGSPIWVETITNYYLSEESGRVQIIGVSREITARKRIEAMVRKLSRAVEQSASTIMVTNIEGIIEFVNPAFERTTGYSQQEAVGKKPSILKSGFTSPETYKNLWQTISHGEVWRGELLNRKKNNDLYWEYVVISPVRDADGRITDYVAVKDDITVRKQAEATLKQYTQSLEELKERLSEQAMRDPLTGVFNRRFMMETLEREMARATRDGHPLSLVMMDIDHFKKVNDTYGHMAGDEVLKVLAKFLELETRKSDIVSRYGGEEFVVLMPKISGVDAQQRAETWRVELQTSQIAYDDHLISITVSMGIAVKEDGILSCDNLLSHADQALYSAKQAGRNTIVVWQEY